MALVSSGDVLREAAKKLVPAEDLRLSEWADRYFRVVKGGALGQWITRPYQREILDSWTDVRVWRTSIMKSARVGMALDCETPIPTPAGWVRMGDLREGDKVFDETGAPCTVTYCSPIYENRECYEIQFEAGESIVADGDHRWAVESPHETLGCLLSGPPGQRRRVPGPKSGVITTREMVAAHRRSGGSNALRIPVAGALCLPDAALPIPPYTLGLWLGDGCKSDPVIYQQYCDIEILDHIKAEGVHVQHVQPHGQHPHIARIRIGTKGGGGKSNDVVSALRQLGIWGNKRIPQVYMRSSIAQRLALLQGLMDTDGTIETRGRASFCQADKSLAMQVQELVVSLGMRASLARIESRKAKFIDERQLSTAGHATWRVTFYPDPAMPVFRLQRKASRITRGSRPVRHSRRTVQAVEPVATRPVRCIQVDSAAHLFLAGRSMIPTHNTTLLNIDEAFRLAHDPCSSCTMQATTRYAEEYSRDTFNKIKESVPVVKALFESSKWRDGTDSLLEKHINGADLKFIGANSPVGLRGWTHKVFRCDEVDGYPVMGAGNEGDQIELALNRTIDFWDRVFIECSTPTIEDFSRIEKSFAMGDQRYRFLPCPHCGHMQHLRWEQFWWEKGKPETAVYICESCEKPIEYRERNEMDRLGEWRPTKPANIGPDGREHRSYHIWAAYSYQPNATWGHIVQAYEASVDDPLRYQTWVNTWAGQVYRENAQSRVTPAGLLDSRDERKADELADGCLLLTAGVDVQDDRLEVSVWGWGEIDPERGVEVPEPTGWLVNHVVIYGRFDSTKTWMQLAEMLDNEWDHPMGKTALQIEAMAVDSGDGDHAPYVYEFANRYARRGVIAIKGRHTEGLPPIGKGSKTAYDWKGRPRKTAARVYIVGTDVVKTRVMARLRSKPPKLRLHSQVDEEYCRQLSSERVVLSGGKRKWIRKPGMRAEALDCVDYAYAALHHAKTRYDPRSMWSQLWAKVSGVESPKQSRPRTFNVLSQEGAQ